MIWIILLLVLVLAFFLEIALFVEAATSSRETATKEMGRLLLAIIATGMFIGLLFEVVASQ